MLKKICWAGLLLALPIYAQAQSCSVPEKLWEKPRSGQALLALPEIRACVQQHLQQPDSALLIHHGQADEAGLRAAELRYWLIALALDGARIDLKNDLQPNEPIRMEVKDKQ